MPDIPTMAEAGLPFEVVAWLGIIAPAGTPKEIVNKLNAEINHVSDSSRSWRLTAGQVGRHGRDFQSAGLTMPGSSGCAIGGTGPRSGSTGNSVGLGTGFPPGDSGGSSSGRVERVVELMDSEHRDQRLYRDTGVHQSYRGSHTDQHGRAIGEHRHHQAAGTPAA